MNSCSPSLWGAVAPRLELAREGPTKASVTQARTREMRSGSQNGQKGKHDQANSQHRVLLDNVRPLLIAISDLIVRSVN